MKKGHDWLNEDFLKISKKKKKSMNIQIILCLCFLCCKGSALVQLLDQQVHPAIFLLGWSCWWATTSSSSPSWPSGRSTYPSDSPTPTRGYWCCPSSCSSCVFAIAAYPLMHWHYGKLGKYFLINMFRFPSSYWLMTVLYGCRPLLKGVFHACLYHRPVLQISCLMAVEVLTLLTVLSCQFVRTISLSW